MTQTIEAIYQNGIFKPLKPVSEEITEGERVELVVKTGQENVQENVEENPIMKLAENFYEGLTEEDIDEIERIALDRSNFFGDRKI